MIQRLSTPPPSTESSMRRRRIVTNGVFGVAEYVSQPLGLLLTVPFLLRHMGAAQFGVWVLASAAVNGGSLLSTGFGDAAIKYVAVYRGQGDASGIGRIVRGMVSINLMLSGLIALGFWCLAPYAARHIAQIDPAMELACQQSFRIGSLLLVARSVDNVFASTLRAFEQYGPAVQVSVCSRIAILIAAVVMVSRGSGVVDIMLATLCLSTLAAAAQAWAVRRAVGRISLLPSLNRETWRMIRGFGCFSWLQALSAVILGQGDRVVIGTLLGAPAVAMYALCDQAAQCIHGVVAAGFQVLFPHMSARLETESLVEVRHTLWVAFKSNIALALILGVPVVVLSRPMLVLWVGPDFALKAWPVLSILSASSMLLALNVTAHNALLATGRIRLVTSVNLAAGAAMLLLMVVLTPRFGIVGVACAWLIPGLATCLLYLPLLRMIRRRQVLEAIPPMVTVTEGRL